MRGSWPAHDAFNWLNLEPRQRLAFLDAVALGDQQGGELARLRRLDRDFHFHRFQDHHHVAGADAVARLGFDLPHLAGDFRLDIDAGHCLPLKLF